MEEETLLKCRLRNLMGQMMNETNIFISVKMQKKYFPIVNQLRIRLPPEFISAKYKQIKVIDVKFLKETERFGKNKETGVLEENSKYTKPSEEIQLFSNIPESKNKNFVCLANMDFNMQDTLVFPIKQQMEFLEFKFKTVAGKNLNKEMLLQEPVNEITYQYIDPETKEMKSGKRIEETGEIRLFDEKNYILTLETDKDYIIKNITVFPDLNHQTIKHSFEKPNELNFPGNSWNFIMYHLLKEYDVDEEDNQETFHKYTFKFTKGTIKRPVIKNKYKFFIILQLEYSN